MSHVAEVDIEIKSLDDLELACKRAGLEFVRGKKDYHWYGEHVGDYPVPEGFTKEDLGKCEHCIRLTEETKQIVKASQKPYEIGVVKRRDGKEGYTLHWDFWSGGFGLKKAVGKDCIELQRQYAAAAAINQAAQDGLSLANEWIDENNSIQLQFVG